MSWKDHRQGPPGLSSKGVKGVSSLLRPSARQGLMLQRRQPVVSRNSNFTQKKMSLNTSSNLVEAQTEMQRGTCHTILSLVYVHAHPFLTPAYICYYCSAK